MLPGLNYISLPLRSSSESNCTYLAKSKESHSLFQEMGLEAVTKLSQVSLIKASYREVIWKERRHMREAMTENQQHSYSNTGRGDLLPYALRTNSVKVCVVYLYQCLYFCGNRNNSSCRGIRKDQNLKLKQSMFSKGLNIIKNTLF